MAREEVGQRIVQPLLAKEGDVADVSAERPALDIIVGEAGEDAVRVREEEADELDRLPADAERIAPVERPVGILTGADFVF